MLGGVTRFPSQPERLDKYRGSSVADRMIRHQVNQMLRFENRLFDGETGSLKFLAREDDFQEGLQVIQRSQEGLLEPPGLLAKLLHRSWSLGQDHGLGLATPINPGAASFRDGILRRRAGA